MFGDLVERGLFEAPPVSRIKMVACFPEFAPEVVCQFVAGKQVEGEGADEFEVGDLAFEGEDAPLVILRLTHDLRPCS